MRAIPRGLPLLVLLFTVLAAKANIRVAFADSVEKMKVQDWKGALEILSELTDAADNEANLEKHGPRYGWFWYHAGYCQTKLGDHKAAIKSFEVCSTAFPNADGAKSKNTFKDYSLFKWAESAYVLKDYKVAEEKYTEFLKEKDNSNPQNEKYSKGKFFTNLAICQFKNGKLDDGYKSLSTATDNKVKFKTSTSAVYAGFDALLALAIKEGKEQMILDFLKSHKSVLGEDVFVSSQYSKLLVSRASEALKAKMVSVPLELLGLIPNTGIAINDLKAVLNSLDGFKSTKPFPDGAAIVSRPAIEELVGKLETESRGGESNEALSLALTGYVWSQAGNTHAAYAAFKELETNYPNSKNRESTLANLVSLCQNLGKVDEVEKYGATFEKTFPKSEKLASVKQTVLSGLYYSKKYEKAINLAASKIKGLEKTKPSPEHDFCLYALGGSYYYTRDYNEASKYLTQSIKEYPESKYSDDVQFMEASSYSRLQEWGEAASKLDAYITKTKKTPSVLFPYALFDRATSYYALQDYDGAIKVLSKIEKEFLNSNIAESALNLKGNVHLTKGENDKAEEYFVKVLESTQKSGNNATGGQANSSLISLLAGAKGGGRSEDIVRYYDLYWKDYAEGSPTQAIVAVAGFPAMKKVNRAQEGLKKMEQVISRVAKLPGQPQLENIINSYSEAYLEVNSVKQLKEHFYNFNIDASDKEAQALLRISLIGAYEKEINSAVKANDEKKQVSLNAQVKSLFVDLKEYFEPSVLTPSSLMEIADFIRLKTATPLEAGTYYQELLDRNNEEYKFKASYGLADILAGSKQAQDLSKAKKLLIATISDTASASKKDREQALYRLVLLHHNKSEWSETNSRSREYIDTKEFTKNRSIVGYYYALSFDKLGNDANARSAYLKVYAANPGKIMISAPSIKRIMELLWKSNVPQKVEEDKIVMSERQAAYDQGWKYIDGTRRLLPKMNDEEKTLWAEVEALVEQYGKSGEVTDMETQLKDSKK